MIKNSNNNLSIKNAAIVHDWYSSKFYGGAEKALEVIHKVLIQNNYQNPKLYGLIKNLNSNSEQWFSQKDIETSFIQKLPFSKNNFQNYLPLFPLAIEQLDLSEFDLIVSSSHLVAKGVLTAPFQLHLSYVHTPMRYAWDQMETYLKTSTISKLGFSPLIRLILHNLRSWDQTSSIRIDRICTNSHFTARRIQKYWGRSSKVIYGPVDVNKFDYRKERKNFYLSVCRLVPNKRVDLLVKAFNKLGLPLIIIGDGSEKNKLKKIANKNIKILGYQSDIVIKNFMETCRAFVYAGIEDFGITPVEAMAAGSPVIALGRGGLLDTVNCINHKKEYSTGLLFKNQTSQNVYDTVSFFEDKKLWKSFSSEAINHWSRNFSKENFEINFHNFLNESIEMFKKQTPFKNHS